MKLSNLSRIFSLTLGLILMAMVTNGANFTSIKSGNWSDPRTWAPTGTLIPGSADAVSIVGGFNVTVTADAACASITFTTTATSLTINTGITLTVAGAITIPRSNSGVNLIAVGAGTLNAGSIAFTSGGTSMRHEITISTGTLSVSGDIVGGSASATIIFTGAGTLKFGGTTFTPGTFTLVSGTTFEYNALGAQTVLNYPYYNLTLSGSGVKTTTGISVNGILSMGGTATASVAPTYSSTSTLQYNTPTARTAGVEWITPFVATGGIIIANTGMITLNSAETLNATSPLTINSGANLNISTFILTLNSNLINNGTLTSGTGNLRIAGSVSGTGIYSSTTGTVEYFAAGNQTCAGYTYNNLTLSVSGTKTTTGATVNGILSMEGTATASAAPTYGPAATLQYNTTTARSAGLEWITPFAATGGVIIKSTGAITLNSPKILNASVPMTISSGSTLNTSASNYQLTFGGDFINSGTLTAGSSTIEISGIALIQNIAGFTTTGLVSLTKTAGTATFTGNVFGGGLTMNGSGGTLDLGVGLTHVFSGIWTRTNGTLNGNSSLLRLGGSVSGSGGTFNAATGTVEWYAAGVQNCAGYTYNNLTLSGSGVKTTDGVTVNGILSMEGTATASAAPTYSPAATLQYNTSTARTTGVEWITPFTTTGGVIIKSTGIITLSSNNVLNGTLTINTGATMTLTSSLTVSGNITNGGIINGGTGTLSVGSNFSGGTFNANTGTVIYYGAAQTVGSYLFNNLTLSGSGIKTTIGVTVSTKLSMEGTATASASPAYGAATILQYNTASARNTGPEWPATFTTTGGVIIANTGLITLISASVLNGPLTINSLAGLSLASTLTASGNIANGGSLNGGTGTLRIGGTVSGSGTFIANSGTVEYYNGNQTVGNWIYNNLTLSTSGIKTITTASVTVNGVLSMEGTATASAAPTYGAAATLQYNKPAAFTAGPEWITPFAATGGVIIANTGAITLNAAKILNASVPLTINTGATLAISTFTLTVNSNIINNGTLTSGSGLLRIGGSINGAGGFTAGTGTVEYFDGIQTVVNYTYNNLTLKGTDVKTTTSGVRVNGVLSMEELATLTVAPTYGPIATLQYNTAAARTAGPEWLTTTGSIIIANTGLITLNSTNVSNGTLTINSLASLSLSSSLTITSTITNNGSLNGTTGILRIGGSVNGGGTFTSGTGTVEYYAGNQTVGNWIYNNLTLSGSGTKSITTASVTVNGILSMAGTATASNPPKYGSTATLQYNTSTNRNSGNEWITPFVALGGIVIANTGTISIQNNKVFGTSVPFTINSGSSFNTQDNDLTFGGDFINNNSIPFDAGQSNIVITGTMANQSIDGFTTTYGDVSMTKTSGIATFTGNVNGYSLTINGISGTLSLGAGLSHTFSATWTRTNGTLDGGSSLLRLGSSVSGIGGAFSANTGTVEYYRGGSQTCANVIYNNLTLSGSNSKTMTTYTVNGILSMEGSATVSAAPIYGQAATLQYNTSSNRTAGVEWVTPFAATGGIIIANTGIITLNSAESFNTSVPLQINSGAKLSTSSSNYQLTFGGNFINNGTFTAGSSPIIITGSMANQTIGGFTTTGSVSMTKTAGIATFTGNVNSHDLIINGNGGTLNLGIGLTHTISGTWTRTNGTLHNGSSLMRLGSTTNITGGAFIGGSGTIEYYGAAQTVATLEYNNLIFSGGAIKTIVYGTAIDSNLLITGTGTQALISNGLNITAGGLTFDITNQTYGTWGSFGSLAFYKNDIYFVHSATGILNVQKPSTLVVTIHAGGGGNVCSGSTISLTSSGTNVMNQYWQGPNSYFSTLQNPEITNATTAMSGKYVVTGSSVSEVNLITNGDFENGYSGITSGYTKNTTTLVPEDTYAVISDPHSLHNDFSPCPDHTTGTGKQMVINGSTMPNISVWSQTITVIPNTNYQYSYWVQSVFALSPAQIQLTINGALIGPPNPATLATCNWTNIIYNWNSGSTTTATIALINQNLAQTGNDFALDDIVFQEVTFKKDSVYVTVNPLAVGGTVSGGSTICSGSSPTNDLSLTGNFGDVVKWQKSDDLAFTSSIDIAETTTTLTSATIGNLSTTSYYRALVQSGTCSSAYSSPATIAVIQGSVGGAVSGSTTICPGSNSGLLTLSGNTGTINKWQYSVAPFSAWTDITNNATTYTSGALTQTTMFRAVVQNNSCSIAYSNAATVTVTPTPTATISYLGSPFCNSLSNDQSVTLNGTGGYTGGTYSSTGGLTIDPVTGAITPSTSNIGTYTVTYNISTSCGGLLTPASTTVTISSLPIATFIYRGTTTPTFINGGVAGTFSSTTGLNFVSASTGEVDLTTSTAGTYTVTNTIAASSGCGIVTANSPITVTSYHTVAFIWTGTASSDWNDPQNWLPGMVPDLNSDVVIPNATTSLNDPVLPTSPEAIVRTINLASYSILNGGTGTTLTIAGSTYAWQNSGTFNQGTSSVKFTNANAGISGATSFYNVLIPTGAGLTPQTGNLMQVSGALTVQGMFSANTNPNTIEYNGTDQTIINPNGSIQGYYNLILSGSGTKLLPVTLLTITGNCSLKGSSIANINGTTTVGADLTIGNGCILNIIPKVSLTVSGTLTNNNGTVAGLVLKSDATGTASLIHNSANVPATVQRYIPGAAEVWHFISSPVSNQGISGSWLPSGTYNNANGYDLYVWNEPSSCWIFNLNLTSPINWNTVHPGSTFEPGRGYLYSLQAANPTNIFTGFLNNGIVTRALTSSSIIDTLKGFNFIGNPYPSAIDWQASSGWSRSNLLQRGQGYDMWIWNPAANNYGVINSASGLGTNDVTRYIAAMQGFFVLASTSGNLQMDNAVRVHDQTDGSFKNAKIYQGILNVKVKSAGDNSFDEVMLLFGNKTNNTGTRKLFSNVSTAPSLYLPSSGEKFTVRYLTDTTDNPSVPVMFKPGLNGSYTLETNFDYNSFETVTLEDRKMHLFQNLKTDKTYRFQASKSDDPNRFTLYFGETKITAPQKLSAKIYTNGFNLVVDLSKVSKETVVNVYDITGRRLLQNRFPANSLNNLNISPIKQILLVSLLNPDGSFYSKVLW